MAKEPLKEQSPALAKLADLVAEQHIYTVLDYLDLWLSQKTPATRRVYANFAGAFTRFLDDRHMDRKQVLFSALTPELSLDFRDYLIANHHTESYANQIGQQFKSFFNSAIKIGIAPPRYDLFPWVSSLKPKATAVHMKRGDTSMLTWLQRIAALDLSGVPGLERSRDLLLFAVITGGAGFLELRDLTPKSVDRGRLYWDGAGWSLHIHPLMQHYLTRLADPNPQHLLLCVPPGLTPEEGLERWHQHLQRLFRIVGNTRIEARYDLPSILCELTLRELRYTPNEIAGFMLQPAEGSSLGMLPTPPLPSATRDAISLRLADEIRDIRRHWFALRLFDKEDKVRRDIERDPIGEQVRLYYPVDEIVRRCGKKLKTVQRPTLRGILFVQSTRSGIDDLLAVRSLAGRINILRNSAAARRSYAVIPDRQIEQFSALVSNCLDVIDAEDFSACQVTPGDYVTITEGPYSGYSGRVYTVRDKKTPQGDDVTMLEVAVDKIGAELAACFGKKLYVTIPQRYARSH
jgi:transcription antitermination factor NusG